MALSVSAAFLAGLLVIFLMRGGHVRLGSALVCALFGFTLATTGLAPIINSTLASIAGVISRF